MFWALVSPSKAAPGQRLPPCVMRCTLPQMQAQSLGLLTCRAWYHCATTAAFTVIRRKVKNVTWLHIREFWRSNLLTPCLYEVPLLPAVAEIPRDTGRYLVMFRFISTQIQRYLSGSDYKRGIVWRFLHRTTYPAAKGQLIQNSSQMKAFGVSVLSVFPQIQGKRI